MHVRYEQVPTNTVCVTAHRYTVYKCLIVFSNFHLLIYGAAFNMHLLK